ncbi:MAG: hypothetical protein KA419_11370 [Acidobacteria bacterium]|nr:hypothetical protein [Acidobacteriota bacterium]
MKRHRRWFRILDVDAGLVSDRMEVVRAVEAEFGLFASPGPAGRDRFVLEARLWGADPFLAVDGRAVSLRGGPCPIFCAQQAFMQALSEKVKRFHLLHGAVVKRGAGLVVLAGPPNIGKTTLARAILEQGGAFFSDDFCPLHRETGKVHPFPRALHVSVATEGEGRPAGKVSVPPRQVCARVGGAPSRPSAIVCLSPGEVAPGGAATVNAPDLPAGRPPAGEQVLVLIGKPGAATRVAELARILEADAPRVVDLGGENRKVAFRPGPASVSATRRWVRDNRALFWSVIREPDPSPDFRGEPVLSPLTLTEAVMLLLREMKHQSVTETPEETGNPDARTPGRLFFDLVKNLAGVPCWRLRVGQLERSAQLVLSLFRPT